MTYKNFPLFNIVLDPDVEDEGLSVISIVDHPAVEQPLFCFSVDEKKKLMFINETKEQHCITSVALLADTPIYRYSPDMGDYYVVFEKQTVRDLVEKYAKDGYQNLVSFNHNGQNIDGFVMIESFFVDKEKGINPTQFKELPDGSWCVTYKCTNDELWETIKNGDLNGYSVEINCNIEPAKEGQQIFDEPEPMEDESELSDEEFMKWVEELLEALEEEGCEVIMSSDKKKDEIELELEAERTDIAKAIDQKKAVLIDGKEYWVHSLGKDGKNDVAVLYDPKNDKWETKDINTIKTWEPTKTTIGEFPEVPKSITDNDDITIQRTVNTGSYSDLIHNRVPVMISYDDEQPQPHTGYRQCAIIAYGYTKRNNECIRVMETYGDSRSAADGTNYIPNYRLMLTRRCKAFKPMIGVQPWGRDILDSRCHYGGDNSMEPCVDAILESDFND